MRPGVNALLGDIVIRPGLASDLDTAKTWLAGESLPVDDLTAEHMDTFLIATQAGTPLGMIGLEKFAAIGLLRSLYVEDSARGGGLGGQLLFALQDLATSKGIVELWLLTIDADQFFARYDFNVVERTEAPAAIQSTAEFSFLCPGDAVLMRKVL